MSTETYTPTSWTGVKPAVQTPTLNIRRNSPFYLMHSAFQWELVNVADDEWEWLPSFSILHETAGVNGVVQTRDGVDSTHTRIKFMEQGYTIIDREFGYVTRYPCRRGGYYYCLKFNRPKTIGEQVFWRMNEDEYNDFRRSLIDVGVIDKPEDEVIELLLKNVDRRIGRRVTDQHIPEIKAQIDELYDLKKRMTESYRKMKNGNKKGKKK